MKKTFKDITCKECGAHVAPTSSTEKWCSDKCRFLSKADRSGGADSCWNWRGCIHASGYGHFGMRSGKTLAAHRFSFEAFVGALPADMRVCHRCDNRACVNPAHIFLGTDADNCRDKMVKGRHRCGRGERNRHALITESDVIAIRAATGTHKDIARRFGLSVRQTGKIVRGEAWRHVR